MKYLAFLLITTFVLFLNAYPNYYAYLNTPEGKVFSGQASWFDPWDINVYVGALKWGQTNGVLLGNTYTTTAHSPVLMYIPYTLTGYFFPELDPFLLFHLLAGIVGFILLLVLWQVIKIFLLSSNFSLIALILISLGGGLGWLFFPQTPSADLFMTGFTFLSHFQRAHEGLGIIFYLLSLTLFYLAAIKEKLSLNLLSLFFLILLLFFYPYYLLSYTLIGGLFTIYLHLKNDIKKPFLFLIFNIFLSTVVLYFYWNHLQGNPGFDGVLSQELKTPDLVQLLLGYGVLIPMLFYQLKKGGRSHAYFFLNLWFFISLLLSFLPLGFARFYLRTLFLPLVLLTLLTLKPLAKKLKVTPKILLLVLVFILPVSSLYITYKRMYEVVQNNNWYYLTSSDQKMLDILRQEGSGKGILTSYTLGNIIPAQTESKVYFGHLLQTPKAQEKIPNIIKFYSHNLTEEEARNFLNQEKISYIVYGREEQEITFSATGDKQLKYKFLKPVFFEGGTYLYTYHDQPKEDR